MPIESACRFIQRLRYDLDFRHSLLQGIRVRDLVQRSLFIEASGFEFSASDLVAARRELDSATAREHAPELIPELDFILCGLLLLEPPRR